MTSDFPNWGDIWDENAKRPDDFSATGRSGMDIVGFLHTVREAARILKLSPCDNLLDIGCGTGIFALALSPTVQSIHGVDISPQMINRAVENTFSCDDLTFSIGSICKPNVPEEHYNKVLAYSVLQYLANPDAVLDAFVSLYNLLPVGGLALYAANPDPAHRAAYLEKSLAGREDKEACERVKRMADQVLWIAPSDMVVLASEAGLKISVEPISQDIWQHFYMYDLILEKP